MANKQFSINDIINEQAENVQVNDNGIDVNQNTAIPVRYKGGETAEDKDGNTLMGPPSLSDKFLYGIHAPGKPLTAKEGEPEHGYEWADEAATEVWNSGKSMDEVEAEMNKKYPLAAARIKEATENSYEYEKKGREPPYHTPIEIDDGDGDTFTSYLSPKTKAEIKIANRYGFMINEEKPESTLVIYKPSEAVKFLNKNKDLKKAWQDFIDGKFSRAELFTKYRDIKSALSNVSGTKDLKTLKKLGFSSQSDYDLMVGYLTKSLDATFNKYVEATSTPVAKKETVTPSPVPVANKEEAPTTVAKKEEAPTTVAKKEEAPTTVAKEEVEVTPNEAFNEEPDNSFSVEEARLNAEATEQEKRAQAEAEAIAEKELTLKEAEDLDKDLEAAARKKQQDLFDYEDWLKNPSLISGIFGKSGLSAARRVGLGLAALFAIFSDVVSNYGKGINNNTDFKIAAMDQLNSTIKTIQDKRADAIGEMSARPYGTTAENEEKLNRDYEKLRRLPTGIYIPKDVLQALIQESQIDTKESMSDVFYNRFMDGSREGFIDSIKKNKTLRAAYLDEDGDLNAAGELKFLNKQEQAIAQYKNVLGLSDERLRNIDSLLNMDRKRAEVRAKVHDVVFQTNADYINAINAMESENRALEESKLGFTEAKTLDAMLDLAQKNRSVIAGLATSSANEAEGTTDTEASANRFSEQGGIDRVNEELVKHGWQAELTGEAGAKFPIKLVPLSVEIKGGGRWTDEQANKHLQSEYERWTRDDQRSLSKARNLSSASGKSIDESYDDIMNFLNSEKAKGAEADFNKVRQEVIDSINNKIQYNNQVIDELKNMRERETNFDTGENNSVSTKNPYVSMFNDVPTKDSNWYRHRLMLT